MDIEALYTVESHEQGAEMQVRDETGKKLDAFITLMGMDSKTFRKANSEHSRRVIEAMADDDDIEQESLSKAVAEATVSWRGFESGGEPLEFSQEAAESLYVNAPYILKQANEFMAVRVNFIKG